jgi:hypothetical protein
MARDLQVLVDSADFDRDHALAPANKGNDLRECHDTGKHMTIKPPVTTKVDQPALVFGARALALATWRSA